jgi:hypothetical protein
MAEVVHAGAAQVTVGDVEGRRFDDLDRDAEAGRKPQHGAGVLRDIGLVDGKSEHGFVIVATGSAVKGAPRRFGPAAF